MTDKPETGGSFQDAISNLDFGITFDVDKLWATTVDVWRNGLFGIDVSQIAIAVAIFIFFLFIRRFFANRVIRRLKVWTERTENRLDDTLIEVVEGPLRFIPVVVGAFFAVDFLDLDGAPATVADNAIRSLIAFAIFWGLYRAVDPLSRLLEPLKRLLTEEMVSWLARIIKGFVALVGGATILEIWGIEVAPIIAGLGLFGVAVALGAQDLFKNLISGALILIEKRFGAGDWVRVDGVVEGTVEQIGFRSTRIRRFDKAPVFVPNAKLSDDALTNFSRMTYRRISWIVGLEYRTDVDQLKTICAAIDDHLRGHDDFVGPESAPLFVRVDSFNDSSIDILIYCFTKTTNWGEWLAAKEALALEIKTIVEGQGAGFAFPSQSLYVEAFPDADKDPAGQLGQLRGDSDGETPRTGSAQRPAGGDRDGPTDPSEGQSHNADGEDHG